ncbi:MAG: hypothetical protein KF786_06515 [Burkholderiaceae bacterium]|nr:hypothetical protein [Burkholderiaceae bacterium]
MIAWSSDTSAGFTRAAIDASVSPVRVVTSPGVPVDVGAGAAWAARAGAAAGVRADAVRAAGVLAAGGRSGQPPGPPARWGRRRRDARRHDLLRRSAARHGFAPHPQFGRIEQERVLADELAGGPVQLDQQVDERLVDRLRGGDPHDRASIGAAIDGEAKTGECWVVFEPRLPERFGRGEPRAERSEFLEAERRDLDFGPQRLTQRRLDGQAAEPGCVGRSRNTACQCRGDRQCENRRSARSARSDRLCLR